MALHDFASADRYGAGAGTTNARGAGMSDSVIRPLPVPGHRRLPGDARDLQRGLQVVATHPHRRRRLHVVLDPSGRTRSSRDRPPRGLGLSLDAGTVNIDDSPDRDDGRRDRHRGGQQQQQRSRRRRSTPTTDIVGGTGRVPGARAYAAAHEAIQTTTGQPDQLDRLGPAAHCVDAINNGSLGGASNATLYASLLRLDLTRGRTIDPDRVGDVIERAGNVNVAPDFIDTVRRQLPAPALVPVGGHRATPTGRPGRPRPRRQRAGLRRRRGSRRRPGHGCLRVYDCPPPRRPSPRSRARPATPPRCSCSAARRARRSSARSTPALSPPAQPLHHREPRRRATHLRGPRDRRGDQRGLARHQRFHRGHGGAGHTFTRTPGKRVFSKRVKFKFTSNEAACLSARRTRRPQALHVAIPVESSSQARPTRAGDRRRGQRRPDPGALPVQAAAEALGAPGLVAPEVSSR